VLFAGASGPNFKKLQAYAVKQLSEAARIAGFSEVAFLDEPTAALKGEEDGEGVVMAVDFGGGTFDVSLIHLTKDAGEVLAIHGAQIGGELFDSLLFDASVAPRLNLDREYEINGKRLPVPTQLRRMRTLHEIISMIGDSAVRSAFNFMDQADGSPLAVAEEIIYGGHAYHFFRAIEAGKIELSSSARATITFRRPQIRLSMPVVREDFESLIRKNLDVVDDQIAHALADAGLGADEVDLVVRTGGSSRIPAFVDRLVNRFGEEKLAERDAFATVALGLAQEAFERWS
jgi:hypothetical chaperone protein